MGGIENARVLLLSNKIQKNGLGYQHDLVGRFFMDHPHVGSGIIMGASGTSPFKLYNFLNRKVFGNTMGTITLSEKVQRERKVLNFSAEIYPIADIQAGSERGQSVRIIGAVFFIESARDRSRHCILKTSFWGVIPLESIFIGIGCGYGGIKSRRG